MDRGVDNGGGWKVRAGVSENLEEEEGAIYIGVKNRVIAAI